MQDRGKGGRGSHKASTYNVNSGLIDGCSVARLVEIFSCFASERRDQGANSDKRRIHDMHEALKYVLALRATLCLMRQVFKRGPPL